MMRFRFGGQVVYIHMPSREWTTKFLITFLMLIMIVYLINEHMGSSSSDQAAIGKKGVLRHIRDIERNANVTPLAARKSGGVMDSLRDAPISAMAAGNVKMRLLLQVQREILTTQVRPPDDQYNINVTLSDMTSMDRMIPDTRPEICRSIKYNIDEFPKATVVIPFYNEALSMLLRTIHSILARSPDSLLHQIILVDDASTRSYLGEPLDRYLHLLPKVIVVRNEKREGLIRSRMRGYRLSMSDVVIFQDAHTECNVGWLEPLLDDLVRHPHSVIQPFVDGVDRLTLDFASPPSYYRGAFSWDLRYTWLKLPDHEYIRSTETGQPFFTPTLVGCVMAVRKDYFDAIGWFDEGLNVWGGENIELGFRTWMCGGRVVSVTCSRVGHVFKEFPYKFDGNKEDIVQKNLIRVAETWMDGYKKYFYATTRIYDFKRAELDETENRSLRARINQRKDMKCHSFEWFMYNVMPEMDIPPMEATFFGEVTSQKSSACWEVTNDHYIHMTYFCFFHKIIPSNNFALTKDGLIKYREKCVKVSPPSPMLFLAECPQSVEEHEKFGIWELVRAGTTWGQVKVKRKKDDGMWERFCISQVTNVLDPHRGEQMPQLDGNCDPGNEFQTWTWTYGLDWSHVPKKALTKYAN